MIFLCQNQKNQSSKKSNALKSSDDEEIFAKKENYEWQYDWNFGKI